MSQVSDDTEPATALTDLTLEELRAYRQELQSEEDLVSYRRRLLHAQIDLLEAGLSPASKFSPQDLVRVLTDSVGGATRRAFVRLPRATLTAIPDLGDVLATDPDRDDPAQVEQALTQLRTAEATLTEHRSSLHARLDEATADLIERYRSNPQSALTVIPRDA